MKFSLALVAALATAVLAQQQPPTPDANGDKNIGNGAGAQFITGACLSDADCASGCCAGPNGICSGPAVGDQNGKTGCGFVAAGGAGGAAGGAASAVATGAADAAATGAADAATDSTASDVAATDDTADAGAATGGQQPPTPDANGDKNIGNGAGAQFITGACLSDADCASGCCAGPNGICSGPAVGDQNGKTGCGFQAAGGLATGSGADSTAAATDAAATGAATDDAAAADTNVAAAADDTAAADSTADAADAGAAAGGQQPPTPDASGDKNIGNGAGAQFITGACLSDADCGSGCCAGPNGICSGVAVGDQNGKTGCGFVSNKKLRRF